MRLLIIVVSLLMFSGFTECNKSCEELPSSFSTYKEAKTKIKSVDFKMTDFLPAGKSSWIEEARYYSCDGISGYMIYKTKNGKEYIHENLPLMIWKEFKTASSSGSYYSNKIRGKYRLVLN